MRKLTLSLMTVFVLLFIVPTQLNAKTKSAPVEVVSTKPVATLDASTLVARLETIKAMDISTLSSSERKELRKELRMIKSELKGQSKSNASINNGSGGVYLSVGAIIIIILLLILILLRPAYWHLMLLQV